MIYVRPDLRPLFSTESRVADFLNIEGEVFKRVQNRRTVRFERGGKRFFIKTHKGIGWREIFKNLITFRLPVVSARNEWRAIEAFERLGVSTMRVAAYGEAGANPATRKSFLVTEALEHTQDLEHWLPALSRHPGGAEGIRLKREVIRRVARIARRLHDNGVNHRDLYLCHLRVDTVAGARPAGRPGPLIHVMDLHRVQRRRRTPGRWVAKDLSALLYSGLFSCPGLVLTRRDCLRFMAAYSGTDWRTALTAEARLWRRVARRTLRGYARHERGRPVTPTLLLGQAVSHGAFGK